MIFAGVNDVGTADTPQTRKPQSKTSSWGPSSGDRTYTHLWHTNPRGHDQAVQCSKVLIRAYSDPVQEAKWQCVNTWIKNSGPFDAVVDFDAIVKDPAVSDMLNRTYISGDFLNPHVARYQAIADVFLLDIFSQFTAGVSGWQCSDENLPSSPSVEPQSHYLIVNPPSILMSAPLIIPLSSLQRNSMALAISSGSLNRPVGIWANIFSLLASSAQAFFPSTVNATVGLTVLEVIPLPPHSTA